MLLAAWGDIVSRTALPCAIERNRNVPYASRLQLHGRIVLSFIFKFFSLCAGSGYGYGSPAGAGFAKHAHGIAHERSPAAGCFTVTRPKRAA
jgi:hypothetical protein